MAGAKYRYEVMEQITGRWSIRSETDSDAEATQQAFLLLADNKVESVRVVEYCTMPGSGRTFNKTVFHQGKSTQTDSPLMLSGHCDRAPICTEVVDLFKLPARDIMNILFRTYLDESMLTPTEIIHSSRHLRTLGGSGALLTHAIRVVAIAQMETHGGHFGNRKQDLTTLISELTKRISELEKDVDRIQKIDRGKLHEYGTFLRSQNDLDEDLRLNYCCIAIGQTISKVSGWEGKLSAIMDLVDPETKIHQEDLRVIDRFVSDVFSGGQAVKEILGAQATLGDALISVASICSGKLAKSKHMPDSLLKLNDMFQKSPLARCRTVLVDRVVKELENGKSLTKDTSEKEIETLSKLATALGDIDGGLDRNPHLRTAIENRSRQQMKPEMRRIFNVVSSPLERVRKLIILGHKAYGEDSRILVVASIRDVISFPGVVEKWVREQKTVLDKMRLLAAIHIRLKALPVECQEKKDSLKILDDFCFDLMTEAKLLQNIESQGEDMVTKANKLLLLARSGAFPDGRTLDALRKRVLFHTQQQGFIKAYTVDAESAVEATTRLAEFKKLLQDAGIV